MDEKKDSVFPSINDVEQAPNVERNLKEHKDAFAKGLPDWDLVPENIVVRRH
ncbi:hypothetical protein [Companilactobacillus keshanensis]|uniref:Uncharacterized protein n=1 Tax=Companilactobacillus keshanensis TaxID=2486003 RepID=A0ABW4BS01_9LACO|nr:hypothetical protein [Companilactobacillus keshanensis]